MRLLLLEFLLKPDCLSVLMLSLLLWSRFLLLRELGLDDRLGVAVPGLGVRLLSGLREGVLLLLYLVCRLVLLGVRLLCNVSEGLLLVFVFLLAREFVDLLE